MSARRATADDAPRRPGIADLFAQIRRDHPHWSSLKIAIAAKIAYELAKKTEARP